MCRTPEIDTWTLAGENIDCEADRRHLHHCGWHDSGEGRPLCARRWHRGWWPRRHGLPVSLSLLISPIPISPPPRCTLLRQHLYVPAGCRMLKCRHTSASTLTVLPDIIVCGRRLSLEVWITRVCLNSSGPFQSFSPAPSHVVTNTHDELYPA